MQKASGHFVILHEQALASGTRRILAVTGDAARAAHANGVAILKQIENAQKLKSETLCETYDELNQAVDDLALSQTTKHLAKSHLQSLHNKVKTFRKEAATSRRGDVLEQARSIAESKDTIIVATIDGADKDSMLTALDAIRSKHPKGAAMLFTANHENGKVIIVAGVSKVLIDKGLKAGDWVREAAKICGGGGGGRPDTAQAGGKDPNKIPVAMENATTFANEVTQ